MPRCSKQVLRSESCARNRLGTVLVLVAICLGCGGGDDRTVIFGEVTYQGAPLEQGKIRLVPTAQTQAPVAGATIDDGKYEINNRGGVMPGTYRVEIVAYQVDPHYADAIDQQAQIGQPVRHDFDLHGEE